MTMLDKVARAAYEKMTEIAAHNRPGAPFLPWQELPEEQKHMAMESQRAALLALREPTTEMVIAGLTALDDHNVEDMDGTRCLVLFGAMLDAALSEAEETTG